MREPRLAFWDIWKAQGMMHGDQRLRPLTAAVGAVVLVLFGNGKGVLAAQPSSTIGDVFVIDLENHNWTQPDGNVASAPVNGMVSSGTSSTGGIQQLYGNPAAPFLNSLVTPGNPNAAQTSYGSNYYEVLANNTGQSLGVHPSEGNYIWQEAGNNDGVTNDNDPYGVSGNVTAIQNYLGSHPSLSNQHLTGLMQAAGLSWKAYAEDTDLLTTTGQNANLITSTGALTSTPVGPGAGTVPLSSFSGSSASYINPYNGSHQYNFADKHVGPAYFTDTNGGNDPTSANVEAGHYSALQQLQSDLNNNTVSQYNLITPDQYNDMHTPLAGGFTYNGIHYSGDAAQIAQGDNFLSIIVPQIEASAAYQNNGMIEIWTDETEADSTGLNQNDFNHTLTNIIISPLAKGNAYNSTISYSHSSDLATMQEIFGLTNTPAGLLNDAGASTTTDLSDLFVTGAIPDPSSVFSVYVYRGPGGSGNAPVSGNWSTSSSWRNGVAPGTSTNKELDFLDTGGPGYMATDDNPGAFSLNALVLGNQTSNADGIGGAPGSSITFAGTTPTITQSGNGPFTIATPIAMVTSSLTINGSGTGPVSITGAISGVNLGLNFAGLNTTTLSGPNTFTGATAVYSGTLALDYTSQNNNKISGTAGLTLGSATLQINGNTSSTFTQSVASLNLSGGAATVMIAAGQTSLDLGAISIAPGAAVNFVNNGTNTSITTSTAVELGNNFGTGILGAYAVYNGTTWATLASNSDHTVVGFTAFGSTRGSTGTIDPNRESLDITASSDSFTGYLETIRYNSSTAVTTTIGTGGVDFIGFYGGILMTANVGANNNIIQGEPIQSGGDFYVHQYDTQGTLTISSQFTDAGNPAYNLIKDGPGTLILSCSGTENYGGNTYINGGLLSTPYAQDLRNTLIFNGGGLQLTNDSNILNPIIFNPGGGAVDVPTAITSTLAGGISGVGGLTKTNAGTLILVSSNTYTGSTLVNGGLLVVAAPGALPTASGLTIGSGATVLAAMNSGGTKNDLIVSSLSISPTGKLDLNNNDMLVQGGSLTTINALVATGYNGGAQNGYGIFSSAAAADTLHLTALGVIRNSVDGTPTGATLYAGFDGFTNTADSDVLIKYTYYGDANLDGTVDGSDYTRVDNGYLKHLTGWFNGDFNYDGVVDGSDYTLIDNSFNEQGATIQAIIAPSTAQIAAVGSAAVPEPVMAGLVMPAMLLVRRRRR